MDLAGAIIGHMVGDYLLQNDWIAANKTKDSLVCALHAMLWTAAVGCFARVSVVSDLVGLGCFAWLFGTHFVIDRWRLAARNMEYTGQRDFKQNMAPWSMIVVDNTWHLVTIWVAWWALASR